MEREQPAASDSQRASAEGKKVYAPPRLTVYGKAIDLTQVVADSSSLISDRHAKEGFAAVDRDAILAGVVALPIETWSYRNDGPGVRHLGPMAQDFAAAFGVGDDDRHIHTVDAGGVALAAIQALHRLVVAQEVRIQALTHEVGALRAAGRTATS